MCALQQVKMCVQICENNAIVLWPCFNVHSLITGRGERDIEKSLTLPSFNVRVNLCKMNSEFLITNNKRKNRMRKKKKICKCFASDYIKQMLQLLRYNTNILMRFHCRKQKNKKSMLEHNNYDRRWEKVQWCNENRQGAYWLYDLIGCNWSLSTKIVKNVCNMRNFIN